MSEKELEEGDVNRAKELTPKGADADIKGNNGLVNLLVSLLNDCDDVNAENIFFGTLLHLAVRGGYLNEAKLLIESGANVHAKGHYYPTPLYYAENPDMVQLLLERGSDANFIGDGVNTPLCYFIQKGDLNTVQLLLDYSADVNAKNSDGKTPLQLAFNGNKIDITKLIIKHIEKLEAASKYVSSENLRLKAKVTTEIIFFDNYRPLIDALPQLGYNGNDERCNIKTFLKENKDKLKVKLGVKDKTLIDFVNFEDVTVRHTPTLQLCAIVSELVKNNTLLKNPNTERHKAQESGKGFD